MLVQVCPNCGGEVEEVVILQSSVKTGEEKSFRTGMYKCKGCKSETRTPQKKYVSRWEKYGWKKK